MLFFFIESLDIESFDIVSFFMTSSAKAAGVSANPIDKVAADRMRGGAFDHDVAISTESIFRPGNGNRCLSRTRKKKDHKDVSESGCARGSRIHHRSFFSPQDVAFRRAERTP